jgi:hypothetical protein
MDLKSQAHEQCYAIVSSFLRQAFGDLAEASDEDPNFYIAIGRIPIYVTASAMGDDDASVSIYAWPGKALRMTDELAMRLLELNVEYRFGGLGVDEDGDIMYEHVLPSQGLSKGALAQTVRLMASSADDIDNELRMRFG